MNPSSKKLYEAPSTECVELKMSNALLQASDPMNSSAYRDGYGAAQELEW